VKFSNLFTIEDDAAQKDFEDRINKLLAHFSAETVDPEGEDEDGFAIFSLADKDGVIVVGTLKDLEDLAEQEKADAPTDTPPAPDGRDLPVQEAQAVTLESLRGAFESIGAALTVDVQEGALNLTAALISEDQTRQFSGSVPVNYTADDLQTFFNLALEALS